MNHPLNTRYDGFDPSIDIPVHQSEDTGFPRIRDTRVSTYGIPRNNDESHAADTTRIDPGNHLVPTMFAYSSNDTRSSPTRAHRKLVAPTSSLSCMLETLFLDRHRVVIDTIPASWAATMPILSTDERLSTRVGYGPGPASMRLGPLMSGWNRASRRNP